MKRSLFKPKNLATLLACRKARKFRGVPFWINALRNLADVEDDPRDDRRRRRRHPAERVARLTLRVIAVCCMMFSMIDLTLIYKRSPTVTTPETMLYPVRRINYPAIAICDVNRISRRAAIDFAQELVDFESTAFTANLTLTDIEHMLSLLGQLYLIDDVDEAENETTKLLHTILERGYNGYDVNRIMRRLSPNCRSMLRRCSWEGKDQTCEDIFLLRKTQDGYCCTFNYARRNDGFGSAQNDVFTSERIEHSTNIGPEYGLSVLLNPHFDDSFYKILPIDGFKISVYNPLDYPDMTSGYVRDVLVSPKTEAYINLDAIVFDSAEDVQKYDVQERDCLFQTEQSKIFHGYYSYSDCIVHCRIRDIFQLCNCVPFFYPTSEEIASAEICNLRDLPCLRKYKERWRNVKPRLENAMEPFGESEFEGYLSCDCLPSCDDVTYSVQSSSIPLSLTELSWGRSKYPINNHSVVHIYFGKSGTIRLRQDVLFYWYELISNYGGVCSLFLGLSIINVIEMLYKLVARVWRSATSGRAQTREKIGENRDDITEVTTIAVQPAPIPEIAQPKLHWREMTGALPNGAMKSV
ncbi:PREDICTED: sodium channel protein Nach-like isoform X2 [Dinoponera quadriceps]|uniref:Sodium channel protein Nach-like isoform X2 n=1 Tax=Dinoponera quadriceps TaxID=609295 RepID=A0A6P3XTE4_DINQU|nr:PREDICTED: sodium channel protein Nach-like isoform X2 [Dinoponera quadriceps]